MLHEQGLMSAVDRKEKQRDLNEVYQTLSLKDQQKYGEGIKERV